MHGFRFFDKGIIESTNHCDDSKFTHITIRKGDIISTRMCDIIVIIIKVLENNLLLDCHIFNIDAYYKQSFTDIKDIRK